MSKSLFVAALAALSIACANGASARTAGADAAPILRSALSAPVASAAELGAAPLQLDAPLARNAESHIVKAGVWSGIKNAAKKVGRGVKKVAVPVGKAVWNNGPVKGVRNAIKAVRELKKRIEKRLP